MFSCFLNNKIVILLLQFIVKIRFIIIVMAQTSRTKSHSQSIQKFVRSRVNYSYNQQVFENELKEQIQSNMIKMQKDIIKDLKRKMILQNQEEIEFEKRQRLKKQLQDKLNKSKHKREKHKNQKINQLKEEKKIREQMFVERLAEIKKKQIEKTEDKLKQIQKKYKIGQPSYNRIDRSVSLIEQPYFQKNLRNEEENYYRLKSIAQNRHIPTVNKLQKRQLSLTQIRPRQAVYNSLDKQKINKREQKLQRIQQITKIREQIMSEKMKNHPLFQKQTQQSQRMRILLETQKQRQETIISKLSKSNISNSGLALSSASKIKSNTESPEDLKGSVIYEISQDREKHSYRRQIKEQIRQYMIKQKQKIIN